MRHAVLCSLGSVALAFEVAAQSAVDVARPEEQQKARRAVVKAQEKRAKHASIIEFRGQQAFAEMCNPNGRRFNHGRPSNLS